MSAAPRIDVWVCARPHAPHLDAVLAALTAAGAEPRVAVSPAGQGLASARNEALAACEGEILALVDDDVEVSPGWLDAQRAAWSSSGAAELGCVGGPLAAVFSGERPAWLGDALLPALGVDPGPPADGAAGVPVPVDAEKRTFHSGNIAFRVTALRGVGGFWPAHGRPGLRDWFGEEHLAQRELARAGWRAAWLHEAHAARRIAPADVRPLDFLRLRARQGARWGAVGPADAARDGDPRRGHGDGGRGGRGRKARRREAGRAGRSCGAQRRGAGRAFARASQPPANGLAHPVHVLRAAGSAGAPQGSGAALGAPCPAPGRSSPLVLLYHRVAAHGDDPLALMVSPPHFAQQLEVLDHAPDARRPRRDRGASRLPESAVAVTVDDGYADVLDPALAEIEAAGIPITVFVSSGHVGTGKAFWWDALARALRVAPADAGPLELDARRRDAHVAGPRSGRTGRCRSVGSQRGFTRSLPRRSRARCGRSGNGRAPATCSPRLPRTGR